MPEAFDEWLANRPKEPVEGVLKPRAVVGEYRILGLIGSGGFAEVYGAEHVRLGTAAAVKLLVRDSDGARRRFEREARILAEARHPGFLRFLSYGEADGRPFIVTELLGECVLPQTDGDVARFLLKVLDALAQLHRLGYVHRDVKPGNLLLRGGKDPVLADFGLACPISEVGQVKGRLSLVGSKVAAVGTPGYAAPEQMTGGGVSAATDVHALGLLADECFGGRPPRCWRGIVDRATNSRIASRYQSAEEMARAIRLRHWRRWLVGVLLAMLALVGVAVWSRGGKPSPGPGEPGTAPAADESAELVPGQLAEAFGIRFGARNGTLPRMGDGPAFRQFRYPPHCQYTTASDRLYCFTLSADRQFVEGKSLEDLARECEASLAEVKRRFGIEGAVTNTVSPETIRRSWAGNPWTEILLKEKIDRRCEYELRGRGCTFRAACAEPRNGMPGCLQLTVWNDRLAESCRQEGLESLEAEESLKALRKRLLELDQRDQLD